MSAHDIEARVLALIVEQDCNPEAERLTSDMRLVADLDWDSLDIVELYMAAEGEFGITLDDEPDRRITVGGVIALVMRAIATQRGAA